MSQFGKSLRNFRYRCNDPENTSHRLSQERFGELLGRELGIQGSFSGAAVSDWERGKSRIRADDRLVLLSMISVLQKYGGIRTASEANNFLESGNYRALNQDEIENIFSEAYELRNATSQQKGFLSFSAENLFFVSNEELKDAIFKAKAGPEPAWPRMLVAVLRVFLDRWTILHSLNAVLWFWVWLFAWASMAASLHWPFSNRTEAISAIGMYTGGALIVPLFIGGLTNTRNNAFWKKHGLSTSIETRLYTYQGAFIGFHLGYFVAFVIGLVRYYLHKQPTSWADLIAFLFPVIIGYSGARLVPYNLWQAYGRLRLVDGWPFFIFIALGPLWGFLFLKSYSYLLDPALGVVTILSAITILIVSMAWQYQRKGTTLVPVWWWAILFGVILICQIIVLLIH